MIYAISYDDVRLSRKEDREIQKKFSRRCILEGLRREIGYEINPEDILYGEYGKPYLKGSRVFLMLQTVMDLFAVRFIIPRWALMLKKYKVMTRI